MNEYLPDFRILLDNADTSFGSVALILFCILLFSCCWSASIAENKVLNVGISMTLGLCIPLVYPVFLLSIPQKQKKTVSDKVKAKDLDHTAHNDDDDLDLPLNDLNEDYFKNIYIDSQGNHNGPYFIDMETNIIKAECINEVHKDFIIIETINSNGAKQRLRIPYAKITSCSQA